LGGIKMEETYKISKIGKHAQYGEWMLSNDGSEKGKFLGITSQVAGFLSNQVPCEIEVEERKDIENRKGVITRVKVLIKSDGEQKIENQVEQPIKIVKPGQKQEFTTARDYKSTPDYYGQQQERQNSIENQFCFRESLHWIEVHNNMCKEEEKIKPTYTKICEFADLIKQKIHEIPQEGFPDY